ncbi:putative lipase 2 [Diaporthe ampelina]|uniref:Carboxylic ester hydrolase n=1 Tax=Diaporthe ampelina TaxID=1214573 RepID=A0A0G2H8J8_9PEZI|nr:putative lipase 2 [Diaporthe ampelina]
MGNGRKILTSLAVLLGPSLVLAEAASRAPEVEIANGTIRGGRCASGTVNYFLSIPYAVPPVGDLRFTPPQPYNQTFAGVRDATTPAPSCPQLGMFLVAYQAGQSEDCLFVDVWAPANATEDPKLPVKVWLHGGGNSAGGISFPLYDGCNSDTAAVHVSLNYRLGALGFLVAEPAGLLGNYGLRDQILALRWVQENIEAFGGDKHKVVVFGQSAGGLDAHILATLDEAPSLMKSAIMQSGAGQSVQDLPSVAAFSAKFAALLPCGANDVACLRAATPEHLNTTLLSMFLNGSDGFVFEFNGFGPAVDGGLVPAHPTEAGVKVPSLIGSTAHEGTLLLYASYGNATASLDQTDYDQTLVSNFGSQAAIVNDTYPVSRYSSTRLPVFYAVDDIYTSSVIHCAAFNALTSSANAAPVYTFVFNHTATCPWLPSIAPGALELLGPAHTSELALVFGQVRRLPFGTGSCNLTGQEAALAAYLQAAWTSMAGAGNPGPDWPEFAESSMLGVVLNDAPVPGVVDYSECAFWEGLKSQDPA